jgi:ketosteroid isomerase-like protein
MRPLIHPMSPAIEAVRQFYAALNRGDVPTVTAHFDPEIGRHEFEGTSHGGTYRGLAEVQALVAKGRGSWAEGACASARFSNE